MSQTVSGFVHSGTLFSPFVLGSCVVSVRSGLCIITESKIKKPTQVVAAGPLWTGCPKSSVRGLRPPRIHG